MISGQRTGNGTGDRITNTKEGNLQISEYNLKKKVKQSRYRPGVAQRVPGS
jgi:hypothetical protein